MPKPPLKLILSRQVVSQLDDTSGLIIIACDCIEDGKPDAACEICEGSGKLYEVPLSDEDLAEIEQNLRRQGVPLGKEGTH